MNTKAIIIDDSPIIRRVAALILKSQNVATREACNGEEALTILERDSSYRLLLVDWNMPKMNGLELIKRVRKEARYNHIKLFVITANDIEETFRLAKENGADDYLVKPISKIVVANKLRQHGLN
ncbi:response regulator [Pelagicoccus albus]|uniref:Response regulator n=1 Tax=Pelagicoccus albus TaxID=415222 RepID=A0A7X1B7B6_9BACT|nr:response regulator [Pelagicoccus albus]MBC2606744.1 response regulator [Pelagicoccus albus]